MFVITDRSNYQLSVSINLVENSAVSKELAIDCIAATLPNAYILQQY